MDCNRENGTCPSRQCQSRISDVGFIFPSNSSSGISSIVAKFLYRCFVRCSIVVTRRPVVPNIFGVFVTFCTPHRSPVLRDGCNGFISVRPTIFLVLVDVVVFVFDDQGGVESFEVSLFAKIAVALHCTVHPFVTVDGIL